MATWKERGEVPDSEDEFGSDTDENATLPSATPVLGTILRSKSSNSTQPSSTKEISFPVNSDIWDLPASLEKENVSRISGHHKTLGQIETVLPSSPLSEPPSELDSDIDDSQTRKQRTSPIIRNYARIFSPDPLAFSPEREPITRNLSASPTSRITGKELAGSGGSDSQPTSLPTADPEVEETQEAERRAAIEPAAGDQLDLRHTGLSGAEDADLGAEEGPLDFSLNNDESIDFPPEYLQFQDLGLRNRTFRPRKPIQKHPYALENALYSKIFKSHGLKPVRLETQSSQRRDPEPEDDSQERDFEDETQETGDTVDLSDESQVQAPLDEPHIHVDLPSSPITPVASLPPHHGGPSSQPSVIGTDNTSVDDDADLDEFPSLDQLIRAPRQQTLSTKAQKRRSVTHLSVPTKRTRWDVNTEPRTHRRPRDGGHDLTPSRPEANAAHITSLPRLKVPAGLFSSSPPRPTPSRQPTPEPVQPPDEHSDTETPHHRLVDLATGLDDESAIDSDTSSKSSASGSETEVIRKVGKRLRGVLPPSYLRLNEQKDARAQRPQQSVKPIVQSPGRSAQRRGVAQRRDPGVGSAVSRRLIFDISDDDDDGQAPLARREPSPAPMLQRTLILEPTIAGRTEGAEELEEESGSSAMEDNHIDLMAPVKPRSKRRPMGAGSSKPVKKARLSNNRSTQSRITSHFGATDDQVPAAPRPAKRKAHRRPRTRVSGSRQTTSRIRPHVSIPKLGILDVIEPGAPRFLKIAARTAKQSASQGRSSPSRKLLQMATRWDHVDVDSVMQNWRMGRIAPRQLPVPSRRHEPLPQRPSIAAPAVRPWPITKRTKVIRQVNNEGNVKYDKTVSGPGQPRSNQEATREPTASRVYQPPGPVYRQAQLETDAAEQTKHSFHLRKRELDNLWRRSQNNLGPPRPFAASVGAPHSDGHVTRPLGPGEPSIPEPHHRGEEGLADPVPVHAGRRSKFRKKFTPTKVDTTAPQFQYANEPVPQAGHAYTETLVTEGSGDSGRLVGLGPFGTLYTQHFEIFPLDPDVFFHESTLIGGGRLDRATDSYHDGRLQNARPRVSFDLDGKTFRWGSWDAQVSSEFGILMDWMVDHLHSFPEEADPSGNATAIRAADFVLSYVQDSMHLMDAAAEQSFAYRILELLKGFQERLDADQQSKSSHGRVAPVDVLSRILVLAFTSTHIYRKFKSLFDLSMTMEDLLVRIAKSTARALLGQGTDPVLRFLERCRDRPYRERGVRPKEAVVHCWVVLMRVLELAHIPRSGFWDVTYSVLLTNELNQQVDAESFESLWQTMFSLLPLREFDSHGTIVTGIRRLISMDGWALPQRLIKRVFDLYKQNNRQPASFNDYCRALLGRCHYLAQEWGWLKCGGIIGTIFDFFGSQDLSHLRNEEAFKSPRFLEELGGKPSLAIEPEDRCFHIFLKFVAIIIKRLGDRGDTNDIRNLIARLMPNHSRVYLKEQALHSHDLASLRNHHDLLCTLFWAAPRQFRPGAHILETLIKPGDSHKDACLVNLRAWNQLARYIAATEEDAETFKIFRRWQFGIFQQLLDQFKTAEIDAQEQYLALSKDDSQGITQARIELVVKMNRAVAKEIVYACLQASLDTMSYARTSTAATFALGSLQLEEVFNHFSLMPVTLDWAMLRVALETLRGYLAKSELFVDGPREGSDVTASFSQAMTALHRELSPSYFSMARCVLGSLAIQPKSATAAIEKETCSELAVVVSAQLLSSFSLAKLLDVSQAFGRGKCSLFQTEAHKLSLSHRRYLPLFVAVLLKRGLSDPNGLGPSLLNIWLLAIVKPRSALAYENQLAEELKKRGEGFVPGNVVGLSINPDYTSNRELFEYAISWMRRSLRQASSSDQKALASNFSVALKTVMEQIKFDLKVASLDPVDHLGYVAFIRDIISLIRSHGTDICAIDEFFYQMNKEYSPSIQDPQLHVAGIVSYGLRLGEGDTRVVPQLFYYLYNNFKVALINNKLGGEARMLRKGMKNGEVLGFVLSKMLPAIITAATRVAGAYTLLDIYCDGLVQLFTRLPASRELPPELLPDALQLLQSILRCLHELSRGPEPHLSAEKLHVACQLCAITNALWPSFMALSYTDALPPLLREIQFLFRRVQGWLGGSISYLGDLLLVRGASPKAIDLFQGLRSVAQSLPPPDSMALTFAESIATDVRRNWIITDTSMTIQAPSRATSSTSTQTGQGVVKQPWDIYESTRPFHLAAPRARPANPGPVDETPTAEQPSDETPRETTKNDVENASATDAEAAAQASRRPRAGHRATLRARQSKKRPAAELPDFRIPQEFLDDNVYIHDRKSRDHPSLFDSVALKDIVDTWSRLIKASGRSTDWKFHKLEEDPRFFISPKGEYHDVFALVLRHSGWNEKDVEEAAKKNFEGVAERSSLVTLTAALAVQAWLMDNPAIKATEPTEFAALLEQIHASAPTPWSGVGLPDDLEAIVDDYSDPEALLPELQQTSLFYKDLSQAVNADLEARPPKHLSGTDIKRPMNVINISGFSGKRISSLLTKYIASTTGADLVRIGAFELSRLVGGYLGQDWAYSKGPMSMMAFRVAEFNDILGEPIQWPVKRDEDDSEGDATVLHLGTDESDGDFKDPLDRELGKIRDNARDYILPSVDRWENLKINVALQSIIRAAETESKDPRNQKLIIQIDDFVELGMTLEGALLIGRLRNIVDNMWLGGKKIALVGTSSSMELSEKHLTSLREIALENSVTICNASRDALGFNLDLYEQLDCLTINMDNAFHMWTAMAADPKSSPTYHSMRLHLHFYHTMLHYLSVAGVVSAKTFAVGDDEPMTSHSEVMEKVFRKLLEMFTEPLRSAILPPTELYHCVRHVLHQNPKPSEVWQAFNLAHWQRDMTIASTNEGLRARAWEAPSHSRSTPSSDAFGSSDQPRRIAETLGITNDYEKKLLTGLIDKDQIKTTFEDVHAPPETISALRLLTSLSLKRPEAFTYGVLARDRIPGCLLYGPPGTGKTLLAKAVAKESGASMLEVSAASINEMWVGQGEKNVQALFSLAKKLEPLVIFIDEADALLASRADNDRRTHRETINQFLREWDGMSDTNAFIMVATNRPFDLDEAVLRRLPRRILVDLPQQGDRLSILKILLRGERLEPSVDLDSLSRRTILYSGSDLKNLCVAAAMAAVREETELADKTGATYPEHRTLRAEHFEHAIKEIGASISDDMKTMREIRRFDETYGKPGKKKKSGMGFSVAKGEEIVKEARVRAS